MNIADAKQQVKDTVESYLAVDELGMYAIDPVEQRPLFLIGAPGIGKTAIMSQVARELGIGLVSYSMTHHTRQSALGLPFVVDGSFGKLSYKATEYTMSEIIASIYDYMDQTGLMRGILFLDEINCVSETLYPSMLQFLQFKTFGRHRVPDGWAVVCAGNPTEYNKSAREFDIVTLDRVRKIEVEPDFASWRDYAREVGVHPSILSFLEIEQDCFYAVESTPTGKRFVSARGWSDLSAAMTSLESLGKTVNLQVVGQFVQDGAIAERFAQYYELFSKYRSDYRIGAILDGAWDDEVVQRAQAAPFDERLAVVNLMLDGLDGPMSDVLEREAVVSAVRAALRAGRARIESGEAVETVLGETLEALDGELAETTATDVAARETVRRKKLVIAGLKQVMQAARTVDGPLGMAGGANGAADGPLGATGGAGGVAGGANSAAENPGKQAFARLSDEYARLVEDMRDAASQASSKVESAFGFIEHVFGNGREMLVFVSNLSARQTAMTFVNTFGSAGYDAYGDRLQVQRRRDDLLERVLELD